MNAEIKYAAQQVLLQLEAQGGLQRGDIFVVGCSTSEILGKQIGTASNIAVAKVLVKTILAFCQPRKVQPAFQCCEHLNRALVVERQLATLHGFEEVSVLPRPEAGGALSAVAMENLEKPVVVEDIACQARAGVDIGSTLIGMHLHPVVVPIRIQIAAIGKAPVVCARSRPKLIGGSRAVYPDW